MKKLLITLIITLACGIKPGVKPWGCSGDWICVCSSDRDCEWVLVCE